MRPDSHCSIRSISAIISLMLNIKTLLYSLDRNSVQVCRAQAGCRGGQSYRRGKADAGRAGLCVPNERWQETLPAPTYLSLHTHSHTGIRTLANCSPCLGHLDYFILFKSGTCRGLKDRTPGSQGTLPYKNAWHKNRTDVLFKWQRGHLINHLCGFHHHGYRKWKRQGLPSCLQPLNSGGHSYYFSADFYKSPP